MFGKEKPKNDVEIFTIYDSKSLSYGKTTQAPNRHVLIRDLVNMFREPAQQKENSLYINAEDYSIFKIGEYSNTTGLITAQPQEHVANLHDLRALAQQNGIVPT